MTPSDKKHEGNHKLLLQSDLDCNIFCHALMNPPAPNSKLQQAADDYATSTAV